ncbi:hypothetical protein DV515_00010949 [Chloebia gouldiae]|uniref:Uncharacterized protein n=1 Tax=Chloebia gouldiae TaxID=44316 RepID=A0A3L8S7Z2_CHLGU|nr:hypothetical protein DV515_00010949 [Chloebia gouldiae]
MGKMRPGWLGLGEQHAVGRHPKSASSPAPSHHPSPFLASLFVPALPRLWNKRALSARPGKEPDQFRIAPDWAVTWECSRGEQLQSAMEVGNQLLMHLQQAPERGGVLRRALESVLRETFCFQTTSAFCSAMTSVGRKIAAQKRRGAEARSKPSALVPPRAALGGSG